MLSLTCSLVSVCAIRTPRSASVSHLTSAHPLHAHTASNSSRFSRKAPVFHHSTFLLSLQSPQKIFYIFLPCLLSCHPHTVCFSSCFLFLYFVLFPTPLWLPFQSQTFIHFLLFQHLLYCFRPHDSFTSFPM